jgi:bile acid-coenzyme A ligase
VLSCLVVGVPHEDLGQVPYAIVQADGLDEAAVIAFLTDRLAGYKLPREVEFSATPLRDDAGKARRSAVRDEIISRRQAQSRP